VKELIEKVEKWAHDRNIIKGSTAAAQLPKLMEEMGELCSGVLKDKRALQADSIGDCLVVLIIIAEQLELDIEMCLAMAYTEIKNRKGRMIDGVFVKEIDLPETGEECPPNGGYES
jgi:NTP pyrophosphatase (non-canonical NTP hydrolase)